MSKRIEFIEFIESQNLEMPEGAKIFFDSLKEIEEKEKIEITEAGKIILDWLQKNNEKERFKAKDIAEGLYVTSRKVSGSMQKLATEGFVEKLGSNPITYMLTEKGKNYNLN